MLDSPSRSGSRSHRESTGSLGGFPCCEDRFELLSLHMVASGWIVEDFSPLHVERLSNRLRLGRDGFRMGAPLCGVEDLARWPSTLEGTSVWLFRSSPSHVLCVNTHVFRSAPSAHAIGVMDAEEA